MFACDCWLLPSREPTKQATANGQKKKQRRLIVVVVDDDSILCWPVNGSVSG